MRTECHSSWIPFRRERRKEEWVGRRKQRQKREEKIKQLKTRQEGERLHGEHVSGGK